MEEKGSALYLCPGCGAFVSENASKCPKCGAELEGAPEDEPIPEKDTGRHDEAELEITLLEKEIAAEEDSPSVTLFMCSMCGAFTSSDAQICSNCGSPIVEDEEAVTAETPVEANQEILEMLVLDDGEPPIEEAGDNIMDYLKKLENAEDVETFLDSMSEDVTALDLQPPKELIPERSDVSDDILSKLIESEEYGHKEETRARSIKSVENLLSTDISVPTVIGDSDTIALCKNCGAFVSETASVCNICGEALAGKKFTARPEQATPDIEVDENQADSIMRKMLGVNIDAPLDTSAGRRFQEDGSLGLCTVCGAFISQEAETCPVCGTHIEDMPEFIPSMDIAEPEQEEHGLAICPHCGVFVQEGARECLSCVKPIPEGATISISAETEKPEEPDAAINLLKTFLGVEKALETTPVNERIFTGLDLCPDCGAFVSMDAVVCGICGSPLFEDAEDMLDIDRQIGEIESPKCPMCGSGLKPDSESCASCGMSFATEAEKVEMQEQDITDFLDTELEATITQLESIDEPESREVKEEMDDLADLLVIEEDSELEAEPEHLTTLEEPIEVPKIELTEEHSKFEPEIEPDEQFEEILKSGESVAKAAEPEWQSEPESLEFIGPLSEETEPELEDYDEEELVRETPTPSTRPAALPRVDAGKQPSIHAANWTTGVYVSIATLCFFLIFYAIYPGDYAPGLAVIFGTLLVIGIYLLATEKSLFFKGDLKHASVFLAGLLVASIVLLHWPIGFLTPESGFDGQPAADRILLGVSVLLTSVGLLWIRARIRFVFTWFFGNALLLLSSIVSFTHSSYGAWLESPVLLVAGFGSTLIVLSLIFLQYERAISTSIETDVVRGDAHYLKRNYASAIESYDDALTKAQMKKVEALGSPLVQYDVPWYSKGSALIFMGQIEEGLKCLDMALAINPCNEVTWVNKGNAHSKLGQHELAEECYTKAIECNPFYEIAWNNLGNVHARQKDYLGALKNYNRAIKINPRYDDAWINKGYVLAKMGKREQAVKCLNHVGVRAKGEPKPIEREVNFA
jgi:predicted amidophosphoribosyltransferase